MNFQNKKAMMGIGTLIIFIATIITAAVAAGVLIRTSSVLQEKAYEVAGEARNRLITGIEVTEIVALSNEQMTNTSKFEIFIRLRAGGTDINMENFGLSFSTEDYSYASLINISLQNGTAPCNFDNLTTDSSFCFIPYMGDNDIYLESGELLRVLYKVSNNSALLESEKFTFSFVPKDGEISSIYATIPDVMNKKRMVVWPK